MSQTRCAVAFALLVVLAGPLAAQDVDEPIWQYDPQTGHAAFMGQDPLGNLMLNAGDFVTSVDVHDGTERWRSTELASLKARDLHLVGMTTIGIVRDGNNLSAVDMAEGERLWDESSLPFKEIRGYISVPRHGILLVYGDTEESDKTLMAVDFVTGEPVWRQDELFHDKPPLDCRRNEGFLVTSCPMIRTGWFQVLEGHQPVIADSDSTFVMYISKDGPVRLNAETGELLWRADDLEGKDIPRPSRGWVHWQLQGGTLFVPSERKLVALDVESGATLWFRDDNFRAPITRMRLTDYGLLVLGAKFDDGRWKDFFMDLVDPATGESVWKDDYRDLRSTRFEVVDDHVLILHATQIQRVSLQSGEAEKLDLSFRDDATASFMQIIDGHAVITAPQQVVRPGFDGAQPYHVYYEAPKYAWWQNALGRAVSGAVSIAVVEVANSMSGTSPSDYAWTNANGQSVSSGSVRMQQYANVYRQLYQPAVEQRQVAIMNGVNYAYINTGEPDGDRTGFNIVRIDKRDGSEAGRLFLGEREPDFEVDVATGTLLLFRDGKVSAYRFPEDQ